MKKEGPLFFDSFLLLFLGWPPTATVSILTFYHGTGFQHIIKCFVCGKGISFCYSIEALVEPSPYYHDIMYLDGTSCYTIWELLD
ncbi:hypothetical protein F4809DRAFT_624833 [Biscogniauxia mediterranea]|nr:hypothetical protein F4809DRAFT_624833 [Biscogniauxia mediterranea]